MTFNSLWPSDNIWRHKSGSTLAQLMAWCLTAPSYHPNQCWLIISKVLWHSSECIFIRSYYGITKYISSISHWISLKITYLKFCSNLPGANEFKLISPWWSNYGSDNTLRGRQDGHHFADDIFKRILLNENVWISQINFVNILRQNGCHFADSVFKLIFLNEQFSILIKISLKLDPKVQTRIKQHWFI